MSPKKAVIVIISLFVLLSTAIGDDAVYKSEHCTITNPRITSGGSESGKSEHYTVTDIQIGNIAGGKAESEHYTIEAFPIRRRLPLPNPPTVNLVTTPTNHPTQTLSGTKDKNTSICINGYEVIPINTDTTWNIASYDIGKEDGLKTLSITSKNKYNLESPSVTVNITLDTIAPAIAITSPENNAEITSSPITVSGTINEECVVVVNGVTAIVDGVNFTVEGINLNYGTNTITAVATDSAGNTSEAKITITYPDKVPPVIRITSPINGAVINKAPITVTGTIDEPCDVIVNGVLAIVTDNIFTPLDSKHLMGFTADGIDLHKGENTITATAYDLAGNSAETSIKVTSSTTSDYELTKVTEDVYEYDPTSIISGSQVSLTVKLEIDGSSASNEPIEFHITQGNGSMVQAVVNTNANGEATGILNTDINASVTNSVEVFDQNFPDRKVIFHIDTKPGSPAQFLKLADETIHPVPGASIELIAKLTDINGNPIQGEEVTFEIVSGEGSLSLVRDTTKDSGEIRTTLTTIAAPNASCTVRAKCSANPGITGDFVITTSGQITVTLDDIDAKVSANNSKIHDIMADVHIISNAPWLPPETQLKIWRKGRKQKVEEISPNSSVHIKPMAQKTALPSPMDREIISFDAATNIYVIKTKKTGQADEYPYEIGYVDYNKGAITKVEYYTKNKNESVTKYIKNATDYTLINGAWILLTLREEWSSNIADTASYVTTSSYSNIVINSGISDSIFE